MNKSSVTKYLLLLFMVSVGFLSALVGQDTSKRENQKSYSEKMNRSFSSFQDSINKNFKSFQEKEQKAFDDFKKKIAKKWGQNNFAISDSVNWVEYYANNDARSTVNFKEGTAQIEVLMDPDDAGDNRKIENEVAKSIKELALTRGKTQDFEIETDDSGELANEPVLDQQLVTKEDEKVTEDNVSRFAEEVISEKEISKTTVEGTDGNTRVLVSISIPLAPDYLKVRAKKVLPIVTKYANHYGIEPELILSVIHVESFFNPKAISHANAVGLMQLVPSSGGLDSYEYVFGKNRQPSRRFLYNPDNNINLGTAYLKILMTDYFEEVTNNVSRRYCAVASYNTGVGNVCQAVSGNKIVSNTVIKVNKMTPDQTYKYLSRNLRYKEAREYIVKVNEKYLMYKGWISLETNHPDPGGDYNYRGADKYD